MRTGRGGFTLIEVLVVLVIASVVFAVLVSVMGSSFEVLRAGESRAKLNANARTVLEYISEDLQNAAYIPLSSDRDLNGFPDEMGIFDPDGTGPQPQQQVGYDQDASYRVAWRDGDLVVYASSYWLSEAWADRIMTRHFSSGFGDLGGMAAESRAVPRVVSAGGENNATQWISFFRLAVPASEQMPYYLALESDRNNDGIVDPVNTEAIFGYPSVVAIGPHKETAVAIQDIWYHAGHAGSSQQPYFERASQIPISSNITRIRYEYFHQVPVYQSRVDGGTLEVAYQSLVDGSVSWLPPSDVLSGTMTERIPMLSHWEQRIIDVAYDKSNTGGQFWVDSTGATYGTMGYRLQDQYPEGLDVGKLDGTHVTPNTGAGLGTSSSPTGWNCSVFYNIDSNGDDINDNAPVDRMAFVSTGISGGAAVEGGLAMMRPDMEYLHGTSYYNMTEDPTLIGDLGDADGIPDGDGQPDDPVPGWWLPYLRSIRITVVATPSNIIEQRTARSGQAGKLGTVVYYRLDSPVPFRDRERTVPLYNQRQDFIGSGQDLVLTKTVPVDFAYRLNLLTDPRSEEVRFPARRRVDINVANAHSRLLRDPIPYDTQIVPLTPYEKLFEKDPDVF